jgi:glycosyltransferase involved in cell wall biosynthesis
MVNLERMDKQHSHDGYTATYDVLVVGQTPPPVNGQNIMIQRFLESPYSHIRLHHVRMAFSRDTNELSAFRLRKVSVLFETWMRVVIARVRTGASVIYFPPAGPSLIPVIRDMMLLISTRWMFRHTVFHFHASGLTEIYPRLPNILKPFFNLAYRNAGVAIVTAKSRESLGHELKAIHVVAVPYGIPDDAKGWNPVRSHDAGHIPCILFVGILCEGKGLLTLIQACALLQQASLPFRVVCAGTWDAKTSYREIQVLLEQLGLTGHFSFPGVLVAEKKTQAFKDADIFCFPSHYSAESSPVVLTEAMSFSLPIVTTNWRGIPDIVSGSGGAFLVEPKQPQAVVDRLAQLIQDHDLRAAMGRKNREWFCANGTIEKYQSNMEAAILKLASA